MASYADTATGHAVASVFNYSVPNLLSRVLATWRHRKRSRHELALLSQSELKDIGYPPSIALESSKSFWIE